MACSALTGISSGDRRTSSAYPRMDASGVRSSWLASATNWRTCDSDSCGTRGPARRAEQLVERGAHLAHLGRGVGVAGGHAVGEHHLAAVQGERGDAVGGADDAVQGAQLAPDEHEAHGSGDQEGEGRRPPARPRTNVVTVLVTDVVGRAVTVVVPSPSTLERAR